MLNGQKEYRVEKDFLEKNKLKLMFITESRRFVLLKTSRLRDTRSMKK